MLDGYFKLDEDSGDVFIEKRKRLLAVQAALEIAKASAGSASGDSSGGTMYGDLNQAAEHIAKLADAIQDALESDD